MKLGFNFINESEPNYYYFKIEDLFLGEYKLYSRNNFQKHKLKFHKDTKEFFNDELTEKDIMLKAGYRRIYDCGNLVYQWRA